LGAGVASILRLPLSAVVLATVLVSKSGVGSEPLIVGVVIAYLTTVGLDTALDPAPRGVRSCNTRPDNSGPGDASAIRDARQLENEQTRVQLRPRSHLGVSAAPAVPRLRENK
jgi:hypothetical protein